MGLAYIKFFCDFNETVKAVTDADLGCLMRAVFAYAAGEELTEMTDVAAALFPMLRTQIDRQRAALAEKTEANRKKRGKEKERTKEKEKREDEEEDEEEDEDEEKKENLLLTQTTRGHTHTRAHASEGGAHSAPTLTEAMLYFRNDLGLIEATEEAEKFVAYNSLRGWDEGKDWHLAADLWAARICDFGGIGDGIKKSLDDHYGARW